MTGDLPPTKALVAFMATLAGPQPATGFLELRHRRRDRPGMRQRFFDTRTPQAAATAATVLSQTGDVYVGCAPRIEKRGTKDAVRHGWTLWVDCDNADAIAALVRLDPKPAIIVRSSGRGLHAYWPLDEPLEPCALERANRRLAYALDGCQSAVTNAAAVLRPPATRNWKYSPPAAVTLARFTGERFSAGQVADCLPDPPKPGPRRAAAPRIRGAARAADPLLAIEPAVYIEKLTGRQVGRDGKVACPFHPDTRPSLHAYRNSAEGWACFSAKCWRGDRPNGGDIYDFAGQLWLTGQSRDVPLRGKRFIEVRERLMALFFGDGEAL